MKEIQMLIHRVWLLQSQGKFPLYLEPNGQQVLLPIRDGNISVVYLEEPGIESDLQIIGGEVDFVHTVH
jgi:hypothetical protein